MGMQSRPSSETLVIWIVLLFVVYLVTSCSDGKKKPEETSSGAVKAPQVQQPIVKQWYPHSKYPTLSSPYVQAPLPSSPSMGQPQQPYYPGTYPPPQMTEQTSPQSSPWYQTIPPQNTPSPEYQTQPQYQVQRPWGEFPPLKKKKESTTREEQRPDTIPYGGGQGYGG